MRRSTISRIAIVGQDPMQVEHLWQSMYVHAFYRAGPVLGSAISGIDQALWDIRGKVLGQPVYGCSAGRFDARGVRGYYHTDGPAAERLRRSALRERLVLIRGLRSSTASPPSRPASPATTSGSRRTSAFGGRSTASRRCAKGWATTSTSASTSTPRPSPSVAVDHVQGSGAAQPDVHRGALPAGKRQGDGPHRAPDHRADRHRRAPGLALWLPRD